MVKKKNGISLLMVLYNDGEIVRNALESAKGVVDEIIIAHDGPCKNETLDICREYTKNVFERPFKGMCESHQAFLYRKAKYPWILKIDADEYLTADLRRNIRKMIADEKADAYSLLWPLWDANKKKYITTFWPRKVQFYRKSKISYMGFPNWGEPKVEGNVIVSNYQLGHHPQSGNNMNWKVFYKRDIIRVVYRQAKDTLKEVGDFDNFHYESKSMPLRLVIRRKFPILSAPLFALIAFCKTLFSKNLFRNPLIIISMSAYLIMRSFFYGYYLFRLKRNKNYSNV